MIKILLSIFIILLPVSSTANEISVIDVAKKLNNDIIIIDVRNVDEWKETGVIPDSRLIQMLSPEGLVRKNFIGELLTTLGDDKNIEVAIICRSGRRSAATVAMLKDQGFTNIFNVTEGMMGDGKTTGWKNKNLPLVKCNEECK